MNLTSTLGGQFFILEKLKPFGLPLAILMLMVMMVIPLPAFLLDVFFTTNISTFFTNINGITSYL